MEPVARDRLWWGLLACCGIGLLLGGAWFAARHPLWEGLQDPRSNWARLAGATWLRLGEHLAVAFVLAGAYWAALRVLAQKATAEAVAEARERATDTTAVVHTATGYTRQVRGGERHRARAGVLAGVFTIAAPWLLVSVLLAGVAPAGESRDVLDYTFRGRMLVEEGASPLARTPSEFSDRPFYAYIAWPEHVDTYGPLWEYASGGVALGVRSFLQRAGAWPAPAEPCPQMAAACSALAAYVVGYRVLAIALTGLCGVMVYGLVRRSKPAWALTALAVWLWNPLVLVAGAVGAHNDLLMLAMQLGSLWLLQRRRWLAGLTVLLLAANVKLTALLVLPVVGLWTVRQVGWGRAIGYALAGAIGCVVLAWLLYAPLGGWETLPRMLAERARYVANSPHHLLLRVLSEAGLAGAPLRLLTITGPSLLFGAAAVATSIVTQGWRRAVGTTAAEEDRRLWRGWVAVILLYLIIGSFWFQPWYFLWLFAPAALLPESRWVRNVTPWLALGGLWSSAAASYLPPLTRTMLDRTGRVAVTVMLTWLPGLLAAIVNRQSRVAQNQL
jgi:hypothetical protein